MTANVSPGASTETAKRRVAALQLTVGRRERLEHALRATLAQAREAHTQAAARRDEQRERVESEREQLRGYHERIAAMMMGGVLSLAELNATMRYADVCAARLQQSENELAAREADVRDKAQALAAASRAVAVNRSRIELCGERIAALRGAVERHAAEAADDEAQETALARLRRAPGIA